MVIDRFPGGTSCSHPRLGGDLVIAGGRGRGFTLPERTRSAPS